MRELVVGACILKIRRVQRGTHALICVRNQENLSLSNIETRLLCDIPFEQEIRICNIAPISEVKEMI
jgi:hypothetical protein